MRVLSHKGGDMVKKGRKETFEKRLKIYSVTAAGVLAIAPAAEAAIHYSGIQNLSVSQGNTGRIIDLNNDGVNDFYFYYDSVNSYRIGISNAANGYGHINNNDAAHHSDAARLLNNYSIKGALANPYYWNNQVGLDTLNGSAETETGYTSDSLGNFNNASGFIGVRFHSAQCQGQNVNYGWIRYQGSTPLGFPGVSGTIIDWAYEDECNEPIAARQRQSASAAVPTLNQWGMVVFTLLLGGIAARMLRKRGNEES